MESSLASSRFLQDHFQPRYGKTKVMLLFFVLVLLPRSTLSSGKWPFCNGTIYLNYSDWTSTKMWSHYVMIIHKVDNMTIPDRFDAREKWPYCKTLSTIVEQGKCGGCWAFTTAMVMSDRLCIFTKGKRQQEFSIQDLLECCIKCVPLDGETEIQLSGCAGGSVTVTFDVWATLGVVTSDCKRFLPKTLENKPLNCRSECDGGSTFAHYWKRKIKAWYPVVFVPSKVKHDLRHLQAELMLYGPVAITVRVYNFYENYKKGDVLICDKQHIEKGDKGFDHSVRLIGWDVINNIPVWIFANSWPTSWGDEGYGYIRRGNNDCGIETDLVAMAARDFWFGEDPTKRTATTILPTTILPTTILSTLDNDDIRPTTIQTWSGGSQCLGWIMEVFSLVWLLRCIVL